MTQHEMTKAEVAHPLEMLTAEEVNRAVAILGDSGRLPEGALFASVVLHEPAKDVQDYVARLGVNFPVLLDAGDTISTMYRVRGYPTSFFVDRGGTVAIEQVGMMSDTQLADNLAQLGLGE